MFLTARPPWQLALLPALLTAIAYVDPGNFGVNVAAGSDHRYALVWVVVMASGMAALIQYLAAKLGMVTGLSLAGNLSRRSGRVGRMLHWLQAEVVVMMTDLAEIVGGAIALNLLFGLPLVLGASLVAALSFVVLAWRRPGHEGFVPVVLGLLGVIVVAFAVEVLLVGVDVGGVLGGLRPRLPGESAVLLAVGIVGATVMPHALHFHSTMTGPNARRHGAELVRRGSGVCGPGDATIVRAPSFLRPTRVRDRTARTMVISVGLAMGLAGLANAALMVFAARLGPGEGADLAVAHAGLGRIAGGVAALLFGVALLASGVASTVVSVFTGQAVLNDFLARRMSAVSRRLVGVIPAMALLVLGMDASRALVLSQVVLSFTLPGTLVPLIVMTSSRSVMGRYANHPATAVAAVVATTVIVGMDGYLLLTALP